MYLYADGRRKIFNKAGLLLVLSLQVEANCVGWHLLLLLPLPLAFRLMSLFSFVLIVLLLCCLQWRTYTLVQFDSRGSGSTQWEFSYCCSMDALLVWGCCGVSFDVRRMMCCFYCYLCTSANVLSAYVCAAVSLLIINCAFFDKIASFNVHLLWTLCMWKSFYWEFQYLKWQLTFPNKYFQI